MQTQTIIDDTRAALAAQRGKFRELAKASGLSVSWISKFANGRRGGRISYETLSALRQALVAAGALDPVASETAVDATQVQPEGAAHG